jgi:methyltransferase
MKAGVRAILSEMGLSIEDIDRFTCHPGGTKVIIAHRAGLFARPGNAQRRTRGHSRLREYVGGDGPVRARTRPCKRLAAAIACDLAGTWLHCQLRHSASRYVTLASLILALVTLQRLGELVLSRYNTVRRLARGAIEVAPVHYPLVVAIFATWLIALWVWGCGQDVDVIALSIFILLPGLRVWVLVTLGRRWTTRIIVLPEAPMVTSGLYRYLSHPNYAIVAAEIAILPLALHLRLLALIFTS